LTIAIALLFNLRLSFNLDKILFKLIEFIDNIFDDIHVINLLIFVKAFRFVQTFVKLFCLMPRRESPPPAKQNVVMVKGSLSNTADAKIVRKG
jgi:hypothetical protein